MESATGSLPGDLDRLQRAGLLLRQGDRCLGLAIPLSGDYAPSPPAVERFRQLLRGLGRRADGESVLSVPESAATGELVCVGRGSTAPPSRGTRRRRRPRFAARLDRDQFRGDRDTLLFRDRR